MTQPDPNPGDLGRSSHIGYYVVGAILAGSAVLAVIFAVLLMNSEQELWEAQVAIQEKGRTLSVDGCVDEVMDFAAGCTALASLCETTVDPMITTCLEGQDRKAYCSGLKRWTGTTGFEFAQCDERGVQAIKPAKGFWDRMLFGGGRQTPQRKTCAAAYRQVADFCEGRNLVELL